MIKYHTDDKTNQISKIELSAQNNSIHNLSHHTSYPAHNSAHTWLPVPVFHTYVLYCRREGSQLPFVVAACVEEIEARGM